MQTVYSLAKQLSDALETNTRANGDKYVSRKDGSPAWVQEVIQAVHADKMPDDTTYAMIEAAADAIAELNDNEADDDDSTRAEDAITEMGTDIYTSDLTAWLHARVDHIYYVNQALEDFGPFEEGTALLMTAQKIQMDEIGQALIEALEQKAEEINEAIEDLNNNYDDTFDTDQERHTEEEA